jgi:hypothetical protein
MVIIPHTPYSPHSAPCDFALFSKLKMELKKYCFETVSDIQRESVTGVLNCSKAHDFHSAFEAWVKKKIMG